MGLQAPAHANDQDWFKKHDTNNDGRWDRAEYERAQRNWEAAHSREHAMSDKQMREYYDKHDKNKDGYLNAEEARHAHHW